MPIYLAVLCETAVRSGQKPVNGPSRAIHHGFRIGPLAQTYQQTGRGCLLIQFAFERSERGNKTKARWAPVSPRETGLHVRGHPVGKIGGGLKGPTACRLLNVRHPTYVLPPQAPGTSAPYPRSPPLLLLNFGPLSLPSTIMPSLLSSRPPSAIPSPTSGVPTLSPTSTTTTNDTSSGPPTPTATTTVIPPPSACWATPQQRRRTRQLKREAAAHEAAYTRRHAKRWHDNGGGEKEGTSLFPLELRLVASASREVQQLRLQRQEQGQQVTAWEAEVRQLEELVARITDVLEGGLMVGDHGADGEEEGEGGREGRREA